MLGEREAASLLFGFCSLERGECEMEILHLWKFVADVGMLDAATM